jgi:hypothetical protein
MVGGLAEQAEVKDSGTLENFCRITRHQIPQVHIELCQCYCVCFRTVHVKHRYHRVVV